MKKKVKLLGISHEGRLNFGFHVDTGTKNASQKCLTRVSNYMN